MSRMEEPPVTKKRLLKAALVLCICVMAAALTYIVYYFIQYFGQKQLEDMTSSIYAGISPAPSSYSLLPIDGPSPTDGGEPAPEGPEPSSPSEVAFLLAAEKEGQLRFADLLDINPDFRGMILIPGLGKDGIELPFVLGPDNDYYLFRDFKGNRNDNGTVFLDYTNGRLLNDRNIVMFGHNMNTGAMFARLHDYRKAETFQTAPIVTLDSLTGVTHWIVFAAYPCEPDWGYVETHPSQSEFAELLEEIQARSLYLTDVEVDATDRILTLSTCGYDGGYEDLRFTVHARRLRPGEQMPEGVAATQNPDPKPFNPPRQVKLADVKASGMAVMQHPTSQKTYYYQIRDNGIDWYSGTGTLQGPYTSFSARVKADSTLTAAYHPEEKQLYLAFDRYGGNKGVHLLYSRYANGTIRFASNDPVTPYGDDARFPVLSYTDGEMWLLYTVTRDDGEYFYRRILRDRKVFGEPEHILTAPPDSDVRVIGHAAHKDGTLLLWHERSSQSVLGTWLGSEEIFTTQLSGQNDRLSFYGAVSGGKVKVMAEKDGKLTPSTFDLDSLPPPVYPAGATESGDDIPVVGPAPEEPDPDPDGPEEPDEEPADEPEEP